MKYCSARRTKALNDKLASALALIASTNGLPITAAYGSRAIGVCETYWRRLISKLVQRNMVVVIKATSGPGGGVSYCPCSTPEEAVSIREHLKKVEALKRCI